MTNQIIEVPDISVVKTVNGEKRLFSLRNQKVKKDSLHDFGIGSGVKYQGDLYVLDNGNIPIVRMTTAKADPSFSVVRSGDIEVDWGDGVREINKFEHTYADGIDNHDIVFYGNPFCLTDLDCHSNLINSLDISKCLGIEALNCSSNLLTYLNFLNNIALKQLKCFSNKLTSLGVSQNTNLQVVICHDNRNLTQLNLSKNVELYYIDCGHCPLLTLDLINNTKIETLICPEIGITSIDLSKFSKLSALNCDQNGLTQIDLTFNPNLQILECQRNNLKELNVSQNIKLSRLSCYRNPLIVNHESIISLANSLPQRNQINKGELYIKDSNSATWIQEICNAKNWIIN